MGALSTEELRTLFAEEFPQATVSIVSCGDGKATVRQIIDEQHLRPGGTVSGPAMMALADAAAYAALLGEIGRVPLAVTTNLNINFMRKPVADRDVRADGSVLKLGQRLAVMEVRIYSEGVSDLVAHATVTYSIPKR